ncbi:GntR family transcriptional regulator [Streptomyces sp. NPDC050788]|uniref:GntR family transcriptional regulator n=1 Tax=Streptomyces sp. NPDC050788 TaxID=3155041 RepID=UPI00343C761A
MGEYRISRGVALRAFAALHREGVAEPVPGARWRVVRAGERTDRRPLEERIADVIADERLEVGAAFLSASVLAERFGVSRPTVTKALDKLEASGVLASGGQGRVRTVRAVPNREERS